MIASHRKSVKPSLSVSSFRRTCQYGVSVVHIPLLEGAVLDPTPVVADKLPLRQVLLVEYFICSAITTVPVPSTRCVVVESDVFRRSVRYSKCDEQVACPPRLASLMITYFAWRPLLWVVPVRVPRHNGEK